MTTPYKPFQYGEQIVVVDSKGRQYLMVLKEGAEFHTHTGFVPHGDFVGQEEGVTVRSTNGARYTAMRPPRAPSRPGGCRRS